MTMIPGDGIGPEISVSVQKIFAAEKVPIAWEEVQVYPILKDGKTTIPDDALASINKNKVALKGILHCQYYRTTGYSNRQGTCVYEFNAEKV